MVDFDQLRRRLLEDRSALQLRLNEHQQAGATVQLDQTRVGRLSRMDAMQQQAMAKAELSRAKQQLRRIGNALQRLDADDFGFCVDCGEAIAAARLLVDPTVVLCFACAEQRS